MFAYALEDGGFNSGFVGTGDDVSEDEEFDPGGGGDPADLLGAGVVGLQARGHFGRVHAVEVLGKVATGPRW